MLQVRVSQTLRDEHGCPEWLDFDFERLSPVEAGVIQQRAGLTPRALLADLRDGVELRDASGEVLLDDEGEPRKGSSWLAWTAVVWVAMRRAGWQTSWQQVADRFNVLDFDWRLTVGDDEPAADDEMDQDLGKGESTPQTTSPPTSRRTSRPSRGSSGSDRGKSGS